ncbi:MAG: histidine--tRNA ligase [Ruminococcaceae bacterium]|nr:histidine--tRNA ligase [Oscillospiraceae bacterium]
MELLTRAPKGTKDVLPSESYKWQYVEGVLRETARQFGYSEIRFPTFEHTELFERGVGDTTDVVQKEMYTFNDKGGRSISLRPEGTASVARSYLENSLYAQTQPTKCYYIAANFRYEKPQAGRYREHHQFGAECFGASAPSADAELISLADTFLHRLGITNITAHINSIGCPKCRAEYHKALRAYFENYKDKLCETCLSRFDKNPMRILDCKSPICSEIAKDAPRTIQYLCDECRDHFDSVRKYLDAMGISYEVDPGIVRGLDYYTKTVFEFVSNSIGAQGTVCGGGRYDGLVSQFGGPATPALGFGSGIERLLLVMDALGIEIPNNNSKLKIFVAGIGEKADMAAQTLVYRLRKAGIAAERDTLCRSLKAQMKYADKLCAEYSVVLGDDEVESGNARLKNMATGETVEVPLDALEQYLQ